MGIRMFQVIVPVLAAIYILWLLWRLYLSKTTWKAVWPGALVALGATIIALFPDGIATRLADFLDFKSTVNAVIFMLIGFLFIGIILLYDLYKKQQKTITKLIMELAILMAEKKEKTP